MLYWVYWIIINTSRKTAQTSLGLHGEVHASPYGGSRLFSINPLILGRCLRGEERFLLHLLIPIGKQTKPNQNEKKKTYNCPVRLLQINLYLLFTQSLFSYRYLQEENHRGKRHPFDNWKERDRSDRAEKFNMDFMPFHICSII